MYTYFLSRRFGAVCGISQHCYANQAGATQGALYGEVKLLK